MSHLCTQIKPRYFKAIRFVLLSWKESLYFAREKIFTNGFFFFFFKGRIYVSILSLGRRNR